MSAEDTKLEKQTRRHRPALYGIAAAILLAGLGYAVLTGSGAVPEDDATAIEPAAEGAADPAD